MPVRKLETIDADTLLGIPYEPPSFVVEGLLPQGLHMLAGAPKIGKSWLALWLCLRVAQGQPLWNFATCPCEVLYLCLEDSFQRIQSRLFDLTEDAPPALHFAVMAEQLRSGLVEQMEQFLREHPATGLSGATDSNFVLRKSKRRENTATLYCTGRDIPYRELSLEFDGEAHIWNLLSDDCAQTEQSGGRISFLLSALLRERPEICAPAKVLLEKIDPAGVEGLTPNSLSHQIRKSVDTLRRSGIVASFRKSNGERLICLNRVDGVDDLPAEKIVTIDPVDNV